MTVIYLAHSTTTPLDPRVRALVTGLLDEDPHQATGLLADGRRMTGLIEAARRDLAAWCGATSDEIIFTSSGTESCNLALKGVSMARCTGRAPAGRILVAATEHTAVLHPARSLGKLGFDVMELPAGRDGVVDPDVVSRMMGPGTFLVSVAGATTETGTIQPVAEIAAVAHERGALMHADLCLASAGLTIDVRAAGIDLASFSAHKLGGPRGTGALYVREGIRLSPLIEGGGGEMGRRGGAPSVAGIAGFAAAAGYRRQLLHDGGRSVAAMTARLEDALLAVAGVSLNGPRSGRMAGMTSVGVAGLDGEALLLKLASSGIAASSGSACLTELGKPSHVLTAMGVPPELARGSLLFSIGPDNTMEEIDRVIEVLPRMVHELRRISPGGTG